MKLRFIVIAFLALVATVAFAGMVMSFECKKCGLAGTYGRGGGMSFDQMSCFCTTSNHFVGVTWDRDKLPPEPAKWDSKGAIYTCWICKTPTARLWDQKTCPKCGSKRIKIEPAGTMYD